MVWILRPCFVRPDEGQTLKEVYEYILHKKRYLLNSPLDSNNKQHQSPMLIHLSFLLVQTRILP